MKKLYCLALLTLLAVHTTVSSEFLNSTPVTESQQEKNPQLYRYSHKLLTDNLKWTMATVVALNVILPAPHSQYAFFVPNLVSTYATWKKEYTDEKKLPLREILPDCFVYSALYAIPTLCVCAAIQYAKTALFQ